MARRSLLQILAQAQIPAGRRVPVCILCLRPVSYATIEHMRPRRVARDRWNLRSNKAISCIGCNARKGDNEPTPAEMARLKALKTGDPLWYLTAPPTVIYEEEPPAPRMVFQPSRPGTIRLDIAAFKEVCADIRGDWEQVYPEHVKAHLLGLHGSYRAWLRLELEDRRDDFLLKEPIA